MNPSEHIVDVNESDFQYEVLAFSGKRPVLVDFWAGWSGQSKNLDPILEKLTLEAGGTFRLAKLEVDANPKIAADYGVRSIPAVKAFRNGQVIAQFDGTRSEAQIREFLKALAPATNDIAVGKGDSLLTSEDWSEAEEAFRDALIDNQDHPGALLGLARSLLAQGRSTDALPILREFPVSKEFTNAEQLIPLAQAMANVDDKPADDDDYAAIYANALRLAGKGQIAAALDGLLEILRASKQYRKGEARKVVLGLLQVLGSNNPQSREYRAELASLLF
jgi:putative thioredoxin